MTKLAELNIKVFINCIEAFLQLFFGKFADGIVGRVMVDIGKQNCLGERRSDMLSRAPVSVAASTNLPSH